MLLHLCGVLNWPRCCPAQELTELTPQSSPGPCRQPLTPEVREWGRVDTWAPMAGLGLDPEAPLEAQARDVPLHTLWPALGVRDSQMTLFSSYKNPGGDSAGLWGHRHLFSLDPSILSYVNQSQASADGLSEHQAEFKMHVALATCRNTRNYAPT